MSDRNQVQPIVVGVSGSRSSQTALLWAAEQAREADVPLLAVHAWESSGLLRAPYAPGAGRRTEDDDRRAAVRLLESALRTAFPSGPGIEVRPVLVRDRPVVALLGYADGALVLALGRSLPPVGEVPRLGPVVRECVGRARCPVVTVPAVAATVLPRRVPAAPAPTLVAHR
jgi:hypothetical protein